jgi:hypothetical protein
MKKYSRQNYFNDPSRSAFSKKEVIVPNNNKDNLNRFETDVIINGRTIFEDKNNMINSLNEEITSLKRKMKYVYDKDKEIQELKVKNKSLEDKIKLYSTYETDNITLMRDKKNLEDKVNELYTITSELSSEKQTLQLTNERLQRELDKTKEIIKEDIPEIKKEDIPEIKKEDSKEDSKGTYSQTNMYIEDKIILDDIESLKQCIQKKLVTIQSDKINETFALLHITDKTLITRELIATILKLL